MQAEKEYVRKNILAAATPLFYAKGYVKVPMRKIAEASHVGLSNIYNYYDSKEDILIGAHTQCVRLPILLSAILRGH